MPEKNREEFARPPRYRLRLRDRRASRVSARNVFADRKGPGAVFRVIPAKILTAEELGLSPHILKLCN